MKNTIRNTLLISAAATALLAGAGLASAQGMNDRREAPTAAPHDQKVPDGKTDLQPGKPKAAPSAQAPDKAKPAPSAQLPEKPAASKQGETAQPAQPRNQGNAQGAEGREMKSGAPAALSAEQHGKFRETLRGEKAEHLTNVRFSITIGEAVPKTVHLYRLPVSILEYAPQYRGYEYIVVGDDILIVDPRTMRIVAVIAA